MKLREARKAAGLSIAQVAAEMGVSRNSIWLWETGKGTPLIGNLRKLANLYGVPAGELLSEEVNENADGAS